MSAKFHRRLVLLQRGGAMLLTMGNKRKQPVGYEIDQDVAQQERVRWSPPDSYFSEKVGYWLRTATPPSAAQLIAARRAHLSASPAVLGEHQQAQ